MRMTPAELVAHHEPAMAVEGTRVVVTFRDQGPARAFRDGLVAESIEIPRDVTRLVRTISLQEGPEPSRAVLELVDGDMRAHRFFVGREDLMRALVAVPIVTAPMMEGSSEVAALSDPDIEARDDLLELAHIHTRLDRAEAVIRLQRQRTNTLMATIVERPHQRNGRFPSYCCQRCGDPIGYVGRAFQAIGVPLHVCLDRREA